MTKKINTAQVKRAREALEATKAIEDAKVEKRRKKREAATLKKLASLDAPVSSAANSKALLRRLKSSAAMDENDRSVKHRLTRVQKAQKKTQKRIAKVTKTMTQDSRRIRAAILGV